MEDLDVVYLVRPGDDNDELRYSLRSLVNVPHRDVWLAGHRPKWCTAQHLPVEQVATKYENALNNLLAILASPDLTESVVLMNDDFFLMQPVDEIPPMHGGPITWRAKHHRGTIAYAEARDDTLRLLRQWGHDEPVTYSIHYPIVVHRPTMADVIDRMLTDAAGLPWPRLARLHLRNLYGNVAQLGGQHVDDCKVYADELPDWVQGATYLSTVDESFRDGPIGQHIRDAFPEPSVHERKTPRRRRTPTVKHEDTDGGS